MHLILGLLFLLFAAVCASLDSITKHTKTVRYHKSCAPCGALTEYKLCLEYYNKYRRIMEQHPNEFRSMIISDMGPYPEIRQYYRTSILPNENFVEDCAATKARLETAKQGKAPIVLTHNTAAPAQIPSDYKWTYGIGISPIIYVKAYCGQMNQEKYAQYEDMERRSAEMARQNGSMYI